jgi:molybdate transport system ATP-binding protein
MTLSVNIKRRLGDFALDVSFDAPDGVTVLFGRSGSGKTSVVNAVAGLLRPDEGRIALHDRVLFDAGSGVDVPVHKRRLGYVFQEARLFPHMSVRDNLLYGRKASGLKGQGDLNRVAQMLGIEGLLDRRPARLSGGEAQRVAIGRALLSEPEILLMDEPLAALDAPRKAEILPYLERLRAESGCPIIYVSHNLAEVARLATHLVVLEDGKVLKDGAVSDLLSDPSMVRVFGVRDAGSVLTAQVVDHADDGVTELKVSGGTLWLPTVPAEVGSYLRVRILAQEVLIAADRPVGLSALNVLPVTVLSMKRGDGPGVIVQLKAGDDTLLARVTRRSADALGLHVGGACFAVLKSVAVAPADVGGGLQSG